MVRPALAQQSLGRLLHVRGELEPLAAELGRDLLKHDVARVGRPVHGVGEAHELLAAPERIPQPGLGVLGLADRVEHVEHP